MVQGLENGGEMTSDELRKLADDEQAVPYEQSEHRTCDLVVDAIRQAADEIDRLTKRVAELEGCVALIRELTERKQLPLTAQINTVAVNALESSCK